MQLRCNCSSVEHQSSVITNSRTHWTEYEMASAWTKRLTAKAMQEEHRVPAGPTCPVTLTPKSKINPPSLSLDHAVCCVQEYAKGGKLSVHVGFGFGCVRCATHTRTM